MKIQESQFCYAVIDDAGGSKGREDEGFEAGEFLALKGGVEAAELDTIRMEWIGSDERRRIVSAGRVGTNLEVIQLGRIEDTILVDIADFEYSAESIGTGGF